LSHFFLVIYSVARLINRPFARATTSNPQTIRCENVCFTTRNW